MVRQVRQLLIVIVGLVGVGVPALVGLLGAVLVVAAPQRPGVAVGPVTAGLGNDVAAEMSEHLAAVQPAGLLRSW